MKDLCTPAFRMYYILSWIEIEDPKFIVKTFGINPVIALGTDDEGRVQPIILEEDGTIATPCEEGTEDECSSLIACPWAPDWDRDQHECNRAMSSHLAKLKKVYDRYHKI